MTDIAGCFRGDRFLQARVADATSFGRVNRDPKTKQIFESVEKFLCRADKAPELTIENNKFDLGRYKLLRTDWDRKTDDAAADGQELVNAIVGNSSLDEGGKLSFPNKCPTVRTYLVALVFGEIAPKIDEQLASLTSESSVDSTLSEEVKNLLKMQPSINIDISRIKPGSRQDGWDVIFDIQWRNEENTDGNKYCSIKIPFSIYDQGGVGIVVNRTAVELTCDKGLLAELGPQLDSWLVKILEFIKHGFNKIRGVGSICLVEKNSTGDEGKIFVMSEFGEKRKSNFSLPSKLDQQEVIHRLQFNEMLTARQTAVNKEYAKHILEVDAGNELNTKRIEKLDKARAILAVYSYAQIAAITGLDANIKELHVEINRLDTTHKKIDSNNCENKIAFDTWKENIQYKFTEIEKQVAQLAVGRDALEKSDINALRLALSALSKKVADLGEKITAAPVVVAGPVVSSLSPPPPPPPPPPPLDSAQLSVVERLATDVGVDPLPSMSAVKPQGVSMADLVAQANKALEKRKNGENRLYRDLYNEPATVPQAPEDKFNVVPKEEQQELKFIKSQSEYKAAIKAAKIDFQQNQKNRWISFNCQEKSIFERVWFDLKDVFSPQFEPRHITSAQHSSSDELTLKKEVIAQNDRWIVLKSPAALSMRVPPDEYRDLERFVPLHQVHRSGVWVGRNAGIDLSNKINDNIDNNGGEMMKIAALLPLLHDLGKLNELGIYYMDHKPENWCYLHGRIVAIDCDSMTKYQKYQRTIFETTKDYHYPNVQNICNSVLANVQTTKRRLAAADQRAALLTTMEVTDAKIWDVEDGYNAGRFENEADNELVKGWIKNHAKGDAQRNQLLHLYFLTLEEYAAKYVTLVPIASMLK